MSVQGWCPAQPLPPPPLNTALLWAVGQPKGKAAQKFLRGGGPHGRDRGAVSAARLAGGSEPCAAAKGSLQGGGE